MAGRTLWCNLGEGARPPAILGLLGRLCKAQPGLRVVLTAARGVSLPDALPPFIEARQRPLDQRAAVDAFLSSVAPDLVVLTGEEVLATAVQACRDQSLPILLVSGRRPEGDFRLLNWSGLRSRAQIRHFDRIFAASRSDAQYFRRCGAASCGPRARPTRSSRCPTLCATAWSRSASRPTRSM